MEWQDQGAVLAVRRHGETAAIVEVFSEAHGRHAGVVRGGTSRKMTPVLQPGNQVSVAWRARLDAHIGSYTIEPLRGRAALLLGDRLALAGLNAVCGLCSATLPERHAYPQLYDRTMELFDLLSATTAWPLAYLRWEVQLLEQIGFGLDLSACAATGQTEGLVYVSPKTGRAVSAEGAGEWADRMLPLPPVLLGLGDAPDDEIAEALGVTGHFLSRNLPERGNRKELPAARARLVDLLARHSASRENTI